MLLYYFINTVNSFNSKLKYTSKHLHIFTYYDILNKYHNIYKINSTTLQLLTKNLQ